MNDKLRTAAQQALDWLELTWICELSGDCVYPTQIASDLRSALAEDSMQKLIDVQQEIEALEALDALIENARLLGSKQQKRIYGVHTPEDVIFERELNESIAKHRRRYLFARLAQPEQEPVESQHRKPIMDSQGNTIGYSDWLPGKGLEWWPHRELYTAPQQREWQGLTEDEIYDCEKVGAIHYQRHKCAIRGQQLTPADDPQWHFARAIEAKLKEKNAT